MKISMFSWWLHSFPAISVDFHMLFGFLIFLGQYCYTTTTTTFFLLLLETNERKSQFCTIFISFVAIAFSIRKSNTIWDKNK